MPSARTNVVVRGRPNPRQAAGREAGLKLIQVPRAPKELPVTALLRNIHGIEECVREAQGGGVGVIAYNRKEGRALGYTSVSTSVGSRRLDCP